MNWNFETAVDTIDSVPEEFRPAYAQNAEGKFEIKAEFKPWATAVSGNIATLNKTRTDLSKANKESADRRGVLKTFEDLLTASGITAGEGEQLTDKLKAHIDELTAKAKNGGELKISLENVRKDFQRQIDTIKAEEGGKVAKMSKTLEKHLIGDVSKSALAKHEGSEKLLMPVIRDSVQVVAEGDDYVVRVIDGDKNVRIDTKTGQPMTIDAFVAELKTNTEYAQAFKSTAQSGSGTRTPTKQTPVRTTPARDQMTPTDKIRTGLQKGQFETNRRG